MAETLSSRLRVLVAKTYRAEKLYTSMRNGKVEETTAQHLNEAANDVRARLWQDEHRELRRALNEIVKLGNSTQILNELSELNNQYAKRRVAAVSRLERKKTLLVEIAGREEFAHALKVTLDLIHLKALLQVTQAISDELSAILSASNALDRSVKSEKKEPSRGEIVYFSKKVASRR